jgi:predicted ATPase
MLTRLHVKGFKSLVDTEVEFRPLTVLFGPNASGKSNILEALQVLSLTGSGSSAAEALNGGVRGHPLEAFAFPPEGLPGLLSQEAAEFSLDADVDAGSDRLSYVVWVETRPSTGALRFYDECWSLEAGQPDFRLGTREPEMLLARRAELANWHTYYLDPRVAMRAAQPPSEVWDIGTSGEFIAPYLRRLKVEHPKLFAAVRRTLRSLVPSVEDLDVDLDERRGELSVQIRQDGCDFSSRVISEGTLRVLALCAIAVNPWAKGLVAVEEPENGVHPRRLDLIAKLLASLATDGGRQVIVTTHSARFCDAVLRLTDRDGDKAALVNVRRGAGGTEAKRIEFPDSLLQDQELLKGLSSPTEDGLFEGLLMRGLLDE